MPLHSYRGARPTVGQRVFIADGAHVIGNVTLGDLFKALKDKPPEQRLGRVPPVLAPAALALAK